MLEHADPHVVAEAIDGLAYVPALARIGALCADPHPDVRHATLAAIDRLGAPGTAIPRLLGGLSDPDAAARFVAVNRLGSLDQFTGRATFERMLGDPDSDVRERARSILDQELPEAGGSQ